MVSRKKFDLHLASLDSVDPHPRNPQKGDVDAVLQSIATDGWHGSVTVRKVEDRWQILVGHTRTAALAKLITDGYVAPDGTHLDYADLAERGVALPPAGQVPITIVDLDDVAAVRKMLADNRASALATVDAADLQAVLAELAEAGALAGSLYTQQEYAKLAREAAAVARDTASEGLRPEDRLAAYQKAGLRSVILPLDAADYDLLSANMNRLREIWGVSTVVEVARRAISEAVDATA